MQSFHKYTLVNIFFALFLDHHLTLSWPENLHTLLNLASLYFYVPYLRNGENDMRRKIRWKQWQREIISSLSCDCLHHPTLIINIIIMITFHESWLHVRQIVKLFPKNDGPLVFQFRKGMGIPLPPLLVQWLNLFNAM